MASITKLTCRCGVGKLGRAAKKAKLDPVRDVSIECRATGIEL
jgi:hypothetical protein